MPAPPILRPGAAAPLGAHWDGSGVNFAVYSRNAEKVELCLFDATGQHEVTRLPLPTRDHEVWHGYLADAQPGQLYGYRAHGPYAPRQGHRFNPHKLLLDPYARELHGQFVWNDAVHGYQMDDAAGGLSFDTRDSAPFVPKCRVTAPMSLDTRPPRPRIPWRDTVLYELHVRGLTMLHPEVPTPLRGTVAALAEPAVIAHLQRLGVTTIELLPVAAFLDELHLVREGLRNYWGYNPIVPLAMHAPYLSHGDVKEFAGVIDRLHEAGIEVILDVVFNHTAEGDERGPTLAYRGLDNAVYYRLDPSQPERYRDFTGCGNTLDLSQPVVVALVHAALRYWACEIGVDGFRFDLASALVRNHEGEFDPQAPLLKAIAADPDLRALKLIAEPWDLGSPGHFLGSFPAPFAEWNDRYRDGVRRFWRGDPGVRGEFATRFAGSSDIFAAGGRQPSTSINFVTAHDGFTLADLNAYAEKHNQANGEANEDGASTNWSCNGGVEGDTEDPTVLAWRRRMRCSMLATLLLSRGTPMLLAGDEFSQSQHGNNNAYGQDNTISWLDWSARDDPWRDLGDFVHRVTRLRRQLTLLRGDRFFDGGSDATRPDSKDIAWLRSDGQELQIDDWNDDAQHGLGILLTDIDGEPRDERTHLYLAMNAGEASWQVHLPVVPNTSDWIVVLDSDVPTSNGAASLHAAGSMMEVPPGGLRALVPHRTRGLGVPAALAARARALGIADEYYDIAGVRRQVPAEGLAKLISAVGDTTPPPSPTAARRPQCWLPPGLSAPPGRWALSAQLYSLRSLQSWGIGDFEDLRHLVDLAARAGADGVLLSPVHALSLNQPQRASPYAPSSRLLFNPLLISVAQVAGDDPPDAYRAFVEQTATRDALARLEAATLIDYPAVAALKLRGLQLLHEGFRDRHLGHSHSADGKAFRQFQLEQGRALRDYATFEALTEWFAQQHGRHLPWTEWPSAYRDPRSAKVVAFEQTHLLRIEFFAYLQWLAHQQWQRAAATAQAAGMELGLIADLALGTDLDSAEAWQWPGLIALDAELGAPPDAFAPRGQRWGAPPWRPGRLAEMNFAPFDALLHATMRDAGAIRMDHVMGLLRQFWIPRGAGPEQGTYVTYPIEALLERVADASRQHHCAVIGEDLGTVPGGFRERLAAARILGYRVVYFERDDDGGFIAPEQYPALAAAAVSTHDLPTIAGFRLGVDIDERRSRGLYNSVVQTDAAYHERRQTLAALASALAPYGDAATARSFANALHRFLAASASRLAIVQIEDVLGLRTQANLPGLGDEAPNWRQRLPIGLEALADDARIFELKSILRDRSRG